MANDAIKDGKVNAVALGRGLIADPHWACKAKLGEGDRVIDTDTVMLSIGFDPDTDLYHEFLNRSYREYPKVYVNIQTAV